MRNAYYIGNFTAIRCIAMFIGLTLANFASDLVIADTNNNNTINVEITTHLGDKQTFKEDDRLSFLVSLDRDAYLLMIYEDAAHNLIQVIPNRYRDSNHYQAGLFVSVPNREEPFRFVVTPPFGKETLWVFAADKPFPTLQGVTFDNGLKKLTEARSVIFSRIRSNQYRSLYGESNTTIFTEAK